MAPLDRSTLEARITLLREQVAAQAALIEQLRRETASLKKDSSNSSNRLRRRTPFPSEDVDRVVHHDHPLDPLLDPLLEERLDEPSVLQQVVLEPHHRRIRVVEHRFARDRHRNSGRVHATARPASLRGPINGGLFDPAMKAYVAAVRVELGGSFRAVRRHLLDVWRLRVSLGYLKKAVFAVTAALDPAYEQIRAAARASPAVLLALWLREQQQHRKALPPAREDPRDSLPQRLETQSHAIRGKPLGTTGPLARTAVPFGGEWGVEGSEHGLAHLVRTGLAPPVGGRPRAPGPGGGRPPVGRWAERRTHASARRRSEPPPCRKTLRPPTRPHPSGPPWTRSGR